MEDFELLKMSASDSQADGTPENEDDDVEDDLDEDDEDEDDDDGDDDDAVGE